MTEQELFNEYRKSNCKSFSDFLINKIAELEKENERLTVSYETLKLHDEEEIGILKSENAELKLKLEALEGQTPWKDIKNKSELIKENTELKELLDCKNCCELEESECETCAEFSHFRCKGKEQLTKAKELLKRFIETSNPIYFEEDRQKVKAEAEQFLKESE